MDRHLYSNSLSAIALTSSSVILEIFPACFFFSNYFIQSQSSLGFSGEKIAEIPEVMIAGYLSNLLRVSLVLLLPKVFSKTLLVF